MKFGKKISIVASLAILLLCISNVAAYGTYFTSFTGQNHASSGAGCHGGTNPKSATGYLQIQCPSGTNVSAGTSLTVSVKVISFIEGNDQYGVVIGFPTPRSNNSFFQFNPAQQNGISLDTSGNSGTYNFSITAPSTAGNYTLEADAIDGHGGNAKLDWANGLLNFTVYGNAPIGNALLLAEWGIIAGFSILAILAITVALRNRARAMQANKMMSQGSEEDSRKKLGVKLKYADDVQRDRKQNHGRGEQS